MDSENGTSCFSFPFQPYAIQEKFMRELYFTVKNKKPGIFESPTGTGKSLSICCSALQWLRDYNRQVIDNLEIDINKIKSELSSSCSNDDWLQEEYEKIQKNQVLASLQIKLEKIKKFNEKFNDMKTRVVKLKCNIGSKTEKVYYHNTDVNKKELDGNKENVDEVASLGEDGDLILGECEDNEEESDTDEIPEETDSVSKIYISSRTHSQLSQFVGEIKRTIFKDESRVVTLASRQHYCINPHVSKLKNVNLINERCLDMQKSKSKSTSVGDDGKVLKRTKTKACTTCPYYNQTNINKLKEMMLVDIMDMEDIVKSGKELKACPYYASRAALDDAEVVLISHAGIVSEGARSGMSLKLQDNVLILDEAHGLTAALENAHCAPVPKRHLEAVKTFLKLYINRYSSKLSSKNLLSLNQLQFIVGKLLGILAETKSVNDKKQDDPIILSLEDFVIKAGIDHLNLRKSVDFCRTTRLAPKLHGFSMRYTPQMLEEEFKKAAVDKKSSLEVFLKNIAAKKTEGQPQEEVPQENKQNSEVHTDTSPGTGLYAVLSFLQMLCERSEYGRVLIQRGLTGQLKYLLLNPSEHFVDVVKQCRSVIVAGGTMEPISEFVTLLTGDAKAVENVNIVKCDHVVPPENVVAMCLSKGPTNVNLSFTFENRMSNELLNEVGCILRNICNIVPGGVVCFLPSYSYEQTLYDYLKTKGHMNSICKRKTVFREPKSAADVDQVLSKYAAAVRNRNGERNGALLMSVVGGKLSEGLNFSDDLGRCVVVFGMPYPNIKSPELQEKLNYLNRSIGPGAGNMYYESLCMKAVNQCIDNKQTVPSTADSVKCSMTGHGVLCKYDVVIIINTTQGRAVRHANDYACVLLVDERYSRTQTMSALPSFVQKSLLPNCTFGKTIGNMSKFFNKHKEKKI